MAARARVKVETTGTHRANGMVLLMVGGSYVIGHENDGTLGEVIATGTPEHLRSFVLTLGALVAKLPRAPRVRKAKAPRPTQDQAA